MSTLSLLFLLRLAAGLPNSSSRHYRSFFGDALAIAIVISPHFLFGFPRCRRALRRSKRRISRTEHGSFCEILPRCSGSDSFCEPTLFFNGMAFMRYSLLPSTSPFCVAISLKAETQQFPSPSTASRPASLGPFESPHFTLPERIIVYEGLSPRNDPLYDTFPTHPP